LKQIAHCKSAAAVGDCKLSYQPRLHGVVTFVALQGSKEAFLPLRNHK